MSADAKLRAYLERVTAELRTTRTRLHELEESRSEPIAIVGMACRFPEGIDTPEKLWDTAVSGREVLGPYPTDRGWELDNLFDDDASLRGKTYSRYGSFIRNAADFDAAFFGMSPREARVTDPQHRLLLETSWEAIESAKIDPASLVGSDTAVFMGAIVDEYGDRLRAPSGSMGEYEGQVMLGNSRGVLSGRISYTLGLEGPAVTIDTACSSSLVALHLGVQALRTGQSSLVLAGGATVMSTLAFVLEFSRMSGLAPDGRSKAFAASADGMGVGEGVGVIVLERLSDAERLGHNILAVIRGSAINQDGASNGLTAPSGQAQQKLIQRALLDARLTAADVDVVEAHGTGTALGDPIEAGALVNTYGRAHTADRPLLLGSIKSNIGHSQGAAGMAGVIKMVYAMRHGLLPRTLHADPLTDLVDWSAANVQVLQENLSWIGNADAPRRAAVSSFGVSGTNAHVILEAAPRPVPADERSGDTAPGVLPWVLSAKTATGVAGQARQLRQFLSERPELAPGDLARSLATTRTSFDHRAAFIADGSDAVLACLDAIADGLPHPAVSSNRAAERRVVFVFPGQGSQWVDMGRELLDTAPVFADRMAECAKALAPFTDWELLAAIRGEEGAPGLDRVDVVQPALFSIMVSLAALWQSLGVEPAAVIGHSQGEIAALCVAGALSLEAAAEVVAVRSRALAAVAGTGTMAALAVGAERARALIADYPDTVTVAARNGPRATVIAGAIADVERIVARCTADGIDARRIDVDYASHSAQMEELRPRLTELTRITAGELETEFFSALLGRRADVSEIGGDYWFENLRRPVEFEGAVRAALTAGYDTFVEVSPHPVLLLAVESIAEDAGTEVCTGGTIRRGDGGTARFLQSAGQLYCAGVRVDWARFFAELPGGTVSLPTYAFERKRFWVDPPRIAGAAPGVEPIDHPMLTGAARIAGSDERVYFGSVSTRTHPWLADHAVQDRILLPGTVFLELAAFVGGHLGGLDVDELTVVAPLVLADAVAAQVQIVVGGPDEARRKISIHSRGVDTEEPDRWVAHASGYLGGGPRRAPDTAADQIAWPPTDAQTVDSAELYDELAARGYHYGPAFRGVQRLWTTPDGFAAEIECPAALADSVHSFVIHPALLDAGLHGFAARETTTGKLVLPFSWQGVTFGEVRSGRLRVHVTFTAELQARIVVRDGHGARIGSIEGLTVRELTETAEAPTAVDDCLFTPVWARMPQPPVLAPAEQPVAAVLLGARGVEIDSATVDVIASLDDFRDIEPALATDSARPVRLLILALPTPADSAPDSDAIGDVLSVLNTWIASNALPRARMLVLTRAAVRAVPADTVHPLAVARSALIRSVQLENPDRITVVDLDDDAALEKAVALAIAGDIPEAAVRRGAVLVPRLARAATARDRQLTLPATNGWRIAPGSDGVVENLLIEESGLGADTELAPDEVLIGVRATGLNFRDVLIALNVYEGPGRRIGNECAGDVLAVGSQVTEFQPGDRVFGRVADSLADLALAHRSELATVPAHWSYAEAASVPITYGSAYHAVVNMAGLQPGERILIHSAASGVGMAAVGLARMLGAEVFATASPQKFEVLTELGIPADHLCSSRDAGFAEAFREVLGDSGFDVAIDAFAGPLVDATLRLMAPGGRFIEIGRADIRDPESVAREYDGVRYQIFDLFGLTPQQVRERLGHIVELVVSGRWPLIPVRSWDIRELPDAFKIIGDGLHVGKNVVSLPRPVTGRGTVLITGGLGMAGAHTARHLVRERGVEHLLLVSRSGVNAPGATELVRELSDLGASVRIAACDIADQDALSALLATIPAEHPLTGVVHAAGVLRDGIAASLTSEDVRTVFAPKAIGAWQLHRLTEHLDLDYFVLFSSVAGVLGNAGQANYAAANGYLDGLARLRRTRGLPVTSIAWGLWSEASTMTADVVTDDAARLKRLGILGMSAADALDLFDLALAGSDPTPVASRFDRARLRSPLFRRDGAPATTAAGANGRAPQRNDEFRSALAATAPKQRAQTALTAVRREIAATLGLESGNEVDPDTAFRGLGFDSLTAVELRNRVNTLTGLRLPTTVVFDNPTPRALAAAIVEELAGELRDAIDDELRALIERVRELTGSDRLTDDRRTRFGAELGDVLRELQGDENESAGADLTELSNDELYEAIDRELELGRNRE
ncbi:SDR family NAD(P)-dependent oxidoreductase [Nocardia sp. NPDC058058]|uniref:SDR family NAD(P)-dependent oxidoreductase n=1 Tax=Nocardia sp. NPDC058058 TaxID=3346317 RepID=UPI0036DADF18